jgi:hypothetical protein
MNRRLPRLLMAFLVGTTLGFVIRACGDDDAYPMDSEKAVATYDSTLAAEVGRWRAEAGAAAVRAESLAAEAQRWQAEAERRRQAWVVARQRLNEFDEVRDELGAMEPDSLGVLAGVVLRQRVDRSRSSERSAGR